MSFCPKCGNKIEETMTFCPNCGTALKTTATPIKTPPVQTAQTEQEKKKKNPQNPIRVKNKKRLNMATSTI